MSAVAARKLATITVHRQDRWAGKMRRVDVLIGTSLVGELASGERQSFEVVPGIHRLLVRAPWVTSNPLELSLRGGDTAEVAYSDDSYINYWGMGTCGGVIAVFSTMLQVLHMPLLAAWLIAAVVGFGTYAVLEKIGVLTPMSRYEASLTLESQGKSLPVES